MIQTSYEWDIKGWPNTLRTTSFVCRRFCSGTSCLHITSTPLRSIRELYLLRYNFLYQSLYLLFIRILYSMIGPMICMGVPIPIIVFIQILCLTIRQMICMGVPIPVIYLTAPQFSNNRPNDLYGRSYTNHWKWLFEYCMSLFGERCGVYSVVSLWNIIPGTILHFVLQANDRNQLWVGY